MGESQIDVADGTRIESSFVKETTLNFQAQLLTRELYHQGCDGVCGTIGLLGFRNVPASSVALSDTSLVCSAQYNGDAYTWWSGSFEPSGTVPESSGTGPTTTAAITTADAAGELL